VSLHSNRYSVPPSFIGRRVEVRETRNQVEIELDARHIVKHQRIATQDQVRVTFPEHRPPRGEGPVSEIRIRKKPPSSPPRPSSRRMWRT
jgi:hypothetical protein